MHNIYEECPFFKNHTVTLRLIGEEDAQGLLNCYSDQKAVPLFNSDNCNGDTFYYESLERMKQAIDFWKYSYESGYFVRMTIILNETAEIIGTVEMFHRGVDPYYGTHGILRIDLMSTYEQEEVIRAILHLANEHFHEEFGVKWMITKAVDAALIRKEVLSQLGYIPMTEFAGKDYYGRVKDIEA